VDRQAEPAQGGLGRRRLVPCQAHGVPSGTPAWRQGSASGWKAASAISSLLAGRSTLSRSHTPRWSSPRSMSAPSAANSARRVTPASSAKADHDRVSSTRVSPTAKTMARTAAGIVKPSPHREAVKRVIEESIASWT